MNFGYIILGRVIERVSGRPYKEYVRARALESVGANRMQQGKSHMSDALPDEVKYYWPGGPKFLSRSAVNRFPSRSRTRATRCVGATNVVYRVDIRTSQEFRAVNLP